MKFRVVALIALAALCCLPLAACKKNEPLSDADKEVQFYEQRADASPEAKFNRTLKVVVDAAHSDPRNPYTREDFPDVDMVGMKYGIPKELFEQSQDKTMGYFYGADAEFDWEAFEKANPDFVFQWKFTVTLPECDAAYAQEQADKFNKLEGFEAKETEYPKVYQTPEEAE